jgi:hypothetical protein
MLVLLYINDFPTFVKDTWTSKPILLADDTSIIVTNSNPTDLISDITTTFEYLNKWFRENSLSLHFKKTRLIQFTTENGPKINANKTMFKAHDTKLLRLLTDSTLPWKLHIEKVLHLLSAACNALRSIKPYMS